MGVDWLKVIFNLDMGTQRSEVTQAVRARRVSEANNLIANDAFPNLEQSLPVQTYLEGHERSHRTTLSARLSACCVNRDACYGREAA